MWRELGEVHVCSHSCFLSLARGVCEGGMERSPGAVQGCICSQATRLAWLPLVPSTLPSYARKLNERNASDCAEQHTVRCQPIPRDPCFWTMTPTCPASGADLLRSCKYCLLKVLRALEGTSGPELQFLVTLLRSLWLNAQTRLVWSENTKHW